MNRLMSLVLFLIVGCVVGNVYASSSGATLFVAASNASETSKANADYVCDGEGDQEEINAAINALPEAGGTVLLSEGTFDIRRIEGKLGGVLIERSYVTLAGQGASTKLVQAAEQETNVIRIIGSDVGYITIRDLYVDANRDGNPKGEGDPNVSHARFEFCGIKAFYTYPGGPTGKRNHHITIRDCVVKDARRLGIMLEGSNMQVLNNTIGNANSDAVEILTGPGVIRGNYFEITGRTHVASGSDRGNEIIMSDNIVHVKETGDLDIAFRSWAQSDRHVITGNIVRVDKGGKLGMAMSLRGEGAVVTGNTIYSALDMPLPLNIKGGNTILTGNMFDNVKVVVDDVTQLSKPIMVNNNLMVDSFIEFHQGKLTTDIAFVTAPKVVKP